MEASIMDSTKRCGAVSGLTTVVNPISLARLVMEKTPHIYLAFDGAETFAREQVGNFYLSFYVAVELILFLYCTIINRFIVIHDCFIWINFSEKCQGSGDH